MLPAPPTAAPASTDSTSSSNVVTRRAAVPWATIIAAILMLYALGMGWGLIAGTIPSERAYLLMAIPCLVPLVWYLAGIVRGLGSRSDGGEQDAGLSLSAAGWLLLGLGLLLKHMAIQHAIPDAYASDASSPLTPLCLGLGVLCLLLGAGTSYVGWLQNEE